LPSRALAGVSESEVGALGRLVPFVREKVAAGGHATAYVCVRGTCRLPVSTAAELQTQLGKRRDADVT
ncbi:MAG: hypothetical protein H7X95_08275, partial [Deltaproteobacteria bacterium]|nr:hypothetical protein [Deltaproteobacteria bacterium]